MTEVPENGAAASSDVDVTQAASATAKASISIGPYRLLERIGEGGMGEVWLAEQARPVQRQVALKVIKAGMDTAQVIARFDAERQALALMDHPAIARVFDGGATPQGRPYFVMEFVRGESITAYATRHKLTLGQRIELFTHVCEGVQHAHQKGIIHRDLKPSNILVTVRDDHPVPKIIDFGVAKAMTQSLTERTLYTEVGALVGTPEYMSPEQAEMGGLDIDTRTDVYALGVILYELLTDTLPFDPKSLREKSLDEIRRVIREVDPPRPSTRVTASAATRADGNQSVAASRLVGQLRGDLDWITMKALEKNRTRRYASVGEFAADLLRHLENQPVLASPPSTIYRAQKFMRRNRVGVAAAGILVALLVAFAGTMVVQTQRIKRERDRANKEAATATQVSGFLAGLFKVSDPSEARGNTLTAREILDKGTRDIERTLATQPQQQVRLQATIGTVYNNLGLYAVAEPMLQRAVAIGRRTLGPDDRDTIAAIHALANVYWSLGKYSQAEPLYVEVAGTRQRLLGADHPDTLMANMDLASLYIMQKRWDVAEPLALRVLDGQRRRLGEDHRDTLLSLNNLESMYSDQKRYQDAEPLARHVADADRRLLGVDHPDTLQALNNLAIVERGLGHNSEAEKLYLEALATQRRVLGDTHPNTCNTSLNLASLYLSTGKYADAASAARASYDGYLQSVGPAHAETARATRAMIKIYEAWGKPKIAAEWRAKLTNVAPSP